ncbi:MAG TPA: M81 family metallopeptidase [Polyangiaceae bacterium]|nr:M81 family metallopeptidase [Polyangiaceae bacterium]
MATRRIAYARIAQESNCFSPVLTTMEDFKRTHFVEGSRLAYAASTSGEEAEGFVKNAELTGFVDELSRRRDVEPVPLFSAWAIPGGPVDPPTFAELCERLETGLRNAGDVDGVLLCLHGAMGAVGVRDPDTEIVRIAKRATNGRARVVVTHDLHANITKERVDECDGIVGYRTNPHRDHRRTGRTAARMLLSSLDRRRDPTTAWRSLPMILGGGATVDLLPPVRSIFSRLDALHRDRRVLGANVYFCHPWNDEKRLGWSTMVSTDGDARLAEDLADELAERCWAVRHQQPPRFFSASEAVEIARSSRLARALGVVVMSDTSDVVTAGAPGDNTRMLATLLAEARDMVSYVPLRDPSAISAFWSTPIGGRVSGNVGGTLDPSRGKPLEIDGKVLEKKIHPALGKMMVIDLGCVKLVVTDGHAMAAKPAFYSDMGLDPWKADIIVVKNFFPFRIYFAPMARRVLYVETEGTTDLDAAFGLDFDGPMWPRDPVHEWRSRDRERRGLDHH